MMRNTQNLQFDDLHYPLHIDASFWRISKVPRLMQVLRNSCTFESISAVLLLNPQTFRSIGRVRVKHRGILHTLKGTIIRAGSIKMIEGERDYECRKCKHRFKVYPELEAGNAIRLPSSCPSQVLK